MTTGIRKAAVLGSGVMGSGIAAHLASCGIRTLLLDIVPFDLKDEEKGDKAARNRFADTSLAAVIKAKPALFVDKRAKGLIETGNFDDDLHRVAECDWIIEVVKEDMAIKQGLLAKVEAHWKPGIIVTTNTSGLSIGGMLEGRSEDFKRHFFGTHFFNPVRYMHLLEVIEGPTTDPEIFRGVIDFVQTRLGKGIVHAKDTPNFIANRVGIYSMMRTIVTMQEMGLTIEEVDAIVGKPMGRPASAAFRTADLVGLDTFMHVSQNCYDALPDDPEREVFAIPSWLSQMVSKGMLGNKTKGGFYKKEKQPDGKKKILALDLDTLEYRDAVRKPQLDSVLASKKAKGDAAAKLKVLIEHEGKAGKFAWKVLSRSLVYAANIASEIADDLVNIDRGMRWGFNWDTGPFETWQALGVKEVADRMKADGLRPPAWVDAAIEAGGFYVEDDKQFKPGAGLVAVPKIPGAISLAALKKANGVIESNRGASLIDMGDGIACLEFHTKMNTIDQDLGTMLRRGTEIAERDFDGLVIANEAEHFSAGANLLMIVMLANQKKWADIEEVVKNLQDTIQYVKYSNIPVVSAPHGLVLGGGAEMAMAADRMMVAHETYMGLVEVAVGLIPGGGGTLNMLKRIFDGVPPGADPQSRDPLPLIQEAFINIGMARVATGAGEVFEFGFGTARDEIARCKDRRIHDAKLMARYMADRGYAPSRPADNLILPGKSGAAALSLFVYGMMLSEFASAHDKLIADRLANVLCGGDTDGKTPVAEQVILDLEREAFLSLVGEPKSLERMQYMLTNNKPLRN